MAACPEYSLAHELKNRVRYHVPTIRKDPEKTYILEILMRKRPGIVDVQANPRTAGVTISFDPEALSSNDVSSHLGSLIRGLPEKSLHRPKKHKPKKANSPPSPESVYAIEGMTCQSCSLLIELLLDRLDNVDKAAVSYASGTAIVTGTASRDEVFDAIRRIGYIPRPVDTLSQRMLLIEREKERLEGAKRRFMVSAVLAAPVMVLGMSMSRRFLPRFLSFLLTTPIVFGAGKPFFTRAYMLARNGNTNMDTLIAIGSGTAYLHSTVSFFAGKRHLYFESAAGIITLILLGRYLEEKARGKASEAIRKLVELQPFTAVVIRDSGEMRIPIDDVVAGDELIVRPGERVPVDGEITSGSTTVDESLVTGESMPVGKETGDMVTGGTINLSGSARFTATAVGADTVLAGIIKMVDQAQSSKVPVQKLADRVSSVFVPAVIGISALTFAGWVMAGRTLSTAMMKSVSVLLISCPCSLGLATPTAVMAGTGAAARDGIYIRNAEALERACHIDVLILDKTGTLTEGKPAVTDFFNLSRMDDKKLVGLAASAEYNSEHFLGRAIVDYASLLDVNLTDTTSFEALVGKGIKATVNKKKVIIGNGILFREEQISLEGLEEKAELLGLEGKTPVFVGVDDKAVAMLGVADRLRDSSLQAVRKLKSMGIETIMVTGDNPRTGEHIADLVGISQVTANATPDRKVEIIKALKKEGRTVGMIGDGINDAPALAEADIGFAIGTGTDIAMEASHVTLVGGDLSKAAEAVALSKKTMVIIKENLFWAFGYNTLAIPLAALGALTPTIASGAMAVSSVSVVANSLRLQTGISLEH